MKHVHGSPKLNMWCSITSDHIIGTFFFAENTIISTVYLDMLQNFVFLEIAEADSLIFQQDGTPPYFGATVHTARDAQFTGRWTGMAGPISQPPQSPDLTSVDFFFWDFMKDIIYKEKVQQVADLQ
jgi:hypothetical protein